MALFINCNNCNQVAKLTNIYCIRFKSHPINNIIMSISNTDGYLPSSPTKGKVHITMSIVIKRALGLTCEVHYIKNIHAFFFFSLFITSLKKKWQFTTYKSRLQGNYSYNNIKNYLLNKTMRVQDGQLILSLSKLVYVKYDDCDLFSFMRHGLIFPFQESNVTFLDLCCELLD